MKTSEGDGWNIERHLGSDIRFAPSVGAAGDRRYDFDDPETGERRNGLLGYEALELKNDLDEAAGRL